MPLLSPDSPLTPPPAGVTESHNHLNLPSTPGPTPVSFPHPTLPSPQPDIVPPVRYSRPHHFSTCRSCSQTCSLLYQHPSPPRPSPFRLPSQLPLLRLGCQLRGPPAILAWGVGQEESSLSSPDPSQRGASSGFLVPPCPLPARLRALLFQLPSLPLPRSHPSKFLQKRQLRLGHWLNTRT